MSAEVVRRSPNSPPEEVLRVRAREWFREGHTVDPEKPPPRRGFEPLPKRWVAERTFAWVYHNRRMSKDYERLCSTGETFFHAATTRPMVRSLAHARASSDRLAETV